MGLFAIILLAIALSLDTFAVALSISLCQGYYTSFYKYRYISIIALFHIIMPLIGWLAGASIHRMIADYDHWIVFLLLSYIGGKMIAEGCHSEPEGSCPPPNRYLSLSGSILFGFILSIDAIIAGFSCAMTNINIFPDQTQGFNMLIASLLIGATAFILTAVGFQAGHFAGEKIGKKSSVFGGIVLIAIAIKTLINHLL